MEKENRRNSILKPYLSQQTVYECEDEQTETFTYTTTNSRRKSVKRVSFAGRDEVKEYQKHEVLTVEKLQKALSQIHNDSGAAVTESIHCMDIENEKENVTSVPTFTHSDEMELTTITSSCSIQQVTHNTVAEPVEMDLSASTLHVSDLEMPTCEIPLSSNVVAMIPISSLPVELSKSEENSSHAIPNETNLDAHLLANESTSVIPKDMDITGLQRSEVLEKCGTQSVTSCSMELEVPSSYDVTENNLDLEKTLQMPLTISPNMSLSDVIKSNFDLEKTYQIPLKDSKNSFESNENNAPSPENIEHFLVSPSPLKNEAIVKEELSEKLFVPGFDHESSDFYKVSREQEWIVTHTDGELTLSKLCNSLLLKFHLSNEYEYHNFRHFVIEDIEIDTIKEIPNKWARFGLTVLENTLENCNLKSICSSTQDLVKVLHLLQEHIHIFHLFLFQDSPKFELMANPRSLTVDIDNMKLFFELSNLENLLLVKVALTLNPIFPLSAQDVTITNIIGNANQKEITNMVVGIRPNGHYLTHAAECIEDFLKCPPVKNDRGVLEITRS